MILAALMLGCEEQVPTVHGDVTWHIDFGPTEEAAGKVDCDYTPSAAADQRSPDRTTRDRPEAASRLSSRSRSADW